MGIIVSTVLGLLIFGYAAWMMVKFFQTSRKGKCAACAIKESCGQSDCRCTDQSKDASI
ncbi:FeoB-associated Cys-rich membrane protein [Sporolactobacillus shoreae]|uniref:FeoB-associated Cys-rich membrane protein n=1 Tax=Sporolactobacillus shoreae TaxID=1465501 RepID=A0A4Z0GJP1_9BACL|nr:FeoB-associated Cys-rich membrane protein [Sporolactobacillus shoreae]TGA96177.1 FeoB-associated Cys-rich membrane protein [Sporolactobacillus shoreae]